MKDSGIEWIGEIPQDWLITKTKNIFYRKKDKSYKDNPTILSLARAGIKVRDISTNDGQLASDYSQYNSVEPGDFLLNPMDLYSGANCNVSNIYGVISPAYFNLKVKSEKYNSKFFDYYFKTQYWAMAMFAHGSGVSHDHRWTINNETLMNYYIPITIQQEQDKVVNLLDNKVNAIDSLIIRTKSTIEDYKQLKQSIITEAVTNGIDKNVEMKDSGIEWIGEIPKHWDITTISKLFLIIGGYAFSSNDFTTEITKNQVIRIGNVRNHRIILDDKQIFVNDDIVDLLSRFKLQNGDIVFSMTGTKGKRDYFYTSIYLSDENNSDVYINQRVGCFRKKIEVNPQYYNYLLKDSKILDSIFIFETGTANQGNLGIDSIKRTKIQFPPQKEQELIAKYLDEKCNEIDYIVAKKETLLTEMQIYKKSLIYEYVTGKKEVN